MKKHFGRVLPAAALLVLWVGRAVQPAAATTVLYHQPFNAEGPERHHRRYSNNKRALDAFQHCGLDILFARRPYGKGKHGLAGAAN